MTVTIANQKGAVLIVFAFLLLVLIGFAALATEAGRWYMVRTELSKAVDAGAFAGAKNISNPYVNKLVLAQEFGQANFPTGYAGTPATGTTAVAFNAVELSDHRIQVTGSVTSPAYLAQLFGVNQVATNAAGVAKKNKVEIMLVLDRSASMAGTPIASLKTAATSFIDFFTDTQAEDKMGLISFATGVKVNFALGNGYVDLMKAAVSKLKAETYTNAEDALEQSYEHTNYTYSVPIEYSGGLKDQTGVPGDQRVQQFVIFFTDGNPTAFRDTFTRDGKDYDAVVQSDLARLKDPASGADLSPAAISEIPTGDGKPTATTACHDSQGHGISNTKWHIFLRYPVTGYSADYCSIPTSTLSHYIEDTGRTLAIKQAQELKNRFVKIYIIGLGGVDKTFLAQIASGPSFEHYAPSSSDLQAIFNAIAKDIRLRLVQ